MMLAEGIACCAAVIVLPFAYLFVSGFEFQAGALVRKTDTCAWRSRWVRLAVAAVAAGLAAGIVESCFFDASAPEVLAWVLTASFVLIAAWADLKERIVPNGVVVTLLVAALLLAAVEVLAYEASWQARLIDMCAGALVCAGVLLLSRVVTKGGVGFGDIKLYFALGLLLGFRGTFNVLLYAMLVAFVYSIVALLTRRNKTSDFVPLAPFTFVGVVLAVLFGA